MHKLVLKNHEKQGMLVWYGNGDESMSKAQRKFSKELLLAIFGTFIFAGGVNLFIVPIGLYSGGFIGIAQIIRTLLVDYLHLTLGGFDIAGIIYYILNIPLFILAYKQLGKNFFIKTIICVTLQTIFLTIIKSAETPILTDSLAGSVVGGILCGYGAGLTLKEGGSGGGGDILGLYFTKKYTGFSVGKIALIVNAFVYGACALMFNITIVIYSLIYAAVTSITMDKVHIQNICISMLIFSNNTEIVKDISEKINRSATVWKGTGAYSGEEINVIYTVVSKYESRFLEELVKERDPNAFVVVGEQLSIHGKFQKRL